MCGLQQGKKQVFASQYAMSLRVVSSLCIALQEWEHHMAHGTISQLMPPMAGHPGSHGTKRQRTFEELAAADTMVDL